MNNSDVNNNDSTSSNGDSQIFESIEPRMPPLPPPRPLPSDATSSSPSGLHDIGVSSSPPVRNRSGSNPMERNRSGSNASQKEREGDAFTTGRKLLMDEIDEHDAEHRIFHSPPGSIPVSPHSSSPAIPVGPVTLAHSIDAHAHHTDYNRDVRMSAAISLGVKASGSATGIAAESSSGSPPADGVSGALKPPVAGLSTSPTPKGLGGFMHNDLLAGSPPCSPKANNGARAGVAELLECLNLAGIGAHTSGHQDGDWSGDEDGDDPRTPEPSPRARRKHLPSSIMSPGAETEAEILVPGAQEMAEYHEMMALAEEIRLKEEKHAELAQLGENLHGVDLSIDTLVRGQVPPAEPATADCATGGAAGESSRAPSGETLPTKSVLLTSYKKRLRHLQRSRGDGHALRVSFATGTAGPSMDSLAVGIVAHEHNTTGNYMEYTVQLWQNGRSWLLMKRYSHFQTFQTELSAEYTKLLADKAAMIQANKAAAHSRDTMTDSQLAQMAKFEEMHRRTSLSLPEDRRPSGDRDSSGSSSGLHGHGHLQHMHTQSGAAMLESDEEDLPLPELPKKRWFETQRWLNR